jgi:hypothetical protein
MFYVSIIEAPVPRGCWLVNARPGKSVRSGLLGSKRRQWRAVDYFFGHLHIGRVRPSFSGQRSIFLNGALFSKTIFYFFGK